MFTPAMGEEACTSGVFSSKNVKEWSPAYFYEVYLEYI
jgi:hypothetical protein